jgi:hypothetical protein
LHLSAARKITRGLVSTCCEALRSPWTVASSLAAAVFAWSAQSGADEPVPPVGHDPGVFPPSHARGSLLLAGAVTTASWYTLALAPSLIWQDFPGSRDLRTPVAGPWMALADTGCPDDNPNCSMVWVVARAVLIGLDGVGQAGGLAVMAEAALMPTGDAKPAPVARRRLPRTSATLRWQPVPIVAGRDGLGIGVVGRF